MIGSPPLLCWLFYAFAAKNSARPLFGRGLPCVFAGQPLLTAGRCGFSSSAVQPARLLAIACIVHTAAALEAHRLCRRGPGQSGWLKLGGGSPYAPCSADDHPLVLSTFIETIRP